MVGLTHCSSNSFKCGGLPLNYKKFLKTVFSILKVKPALRQLQASKLQGIQLKCNFIKCQSTLLCNGAIAKTRSITEDLQSTASSTSCSRLLQSCTRNFSRKYPCNKCHLLQMQELLPERLYPSQELKY